MTIIFNRSVSGVREDFVLLHKLWVAQGRPDDAMLEILGASFHADEDTIFGRLNHSYIAREVAWYDSRSTNVNDMEGKVPDIWRQIASTHDGGGWINSNYGFLLYDDENHSQYSAVVDELHRDANSRRAVAIYTRPTMHEEWNAEGMQDFICTNAVHYEIRDNELVVIVQMRSNDAIFGYRNDYAWQKIVQGRLLLDLEDRYPDLKLGPILWQAASLHIYPRHFALVERFNQTGEYDGEF